MTITPKPLRLFYSYAHEDEDLRDKLDKHLSLLERQGVIESWHDREITGGENWKGQIDEHLERADVILLLISSDFMASDYCSDVEMKRALERDKQGEARVVPVILRPVDWESGPFGKLQALPKDARPVTEWENLDTAFRDVAKGIRRMAASLGGPPDVDDNGDDGGRPSWFRRGLAWLRWHRGVRWAAGTLAVALVLASIAVPWWGAYERRVDDGWSRLKVWRHAEALAAFERALSINPLGSDAKWGREVCSAYEGYETLSTAQFEERVRALERRRPDDPYVEVMLGDLAYTDQRYEEAQDLYERASLKEPKLAEAWFGLGVLRDREQDFREAERMYQKAITIAVKTPKYRNNLAWLLARRGELDAALDEYARNDAYPLSAIEAAKVLWAKGDFPEAERKQKMALKWLNDPEVMGRVENRGPWSVQVSASEGIRFISVAEKRCYGEVALAATDFLAGKEEKPALHKDRLAETCVDVLADACAAVTADLEWAAEGSPSLRPRVDAWRAGGLR